MQGRTLMALLVMGLALAGCTYTRSGPPSVHYSEFRVSPPQVNRIEVCHAYTCQMKTPYTFSKSEIIKISGIMRRVKRSDTPAEERRAIAYAVAHMETTVGKKVGIKDRPGMDFVSSGDPTQQDCVDEATNTTSYLLVLQSNGLLKHHVVRTPMAKDNMIKGVLKGKPVEYWPHWAAVIEEKKTGQRWAVDSWPFKMGENPGVDKVEDWYISDRPQTAQQKQQTRTAQR
jgi:hypothetical protein